jgi:hypothetical protein
MTVLFALLLVGAGLGLMWFSDTPLLQPHKTLQDLINQVGGVLITTGAIAVLWDLFARRELMNEILEKTGVSDEVRDAGVQHLKAASKDISWKELIEGAKSIDVFLAYGRSWFSNYSNSLQKFAESKSTSLNVYLPDPDDSSTMAILASRFGYSVVQLQDLIAETVKNFSDLKKGDGSTVAIFYRKGYPTYTAQRFDRRWLVVSFYPNSVGRADIPTLLLGQGNYLDDFFQKDLDDTATASKALTT